MDCKLKMPWSHADAVNVDDKAGARDSWPQGVCQYASEYGCNPRLCPVRTRQSVAKRVDNTWLTLSKPRGTLQKRPKLSATPFMGRKMMNAAYAKREVILDCHGIMI